MVAKTTVGWRLRSATTSLLAAITTTSLGCSAVCGELPLFRSVDERYEATIVETGRGDCHYELTENGEDVFRSHSEHPNTANDVKSGAFSPNSTTFCAAYHYGPAADYPDGYTWIGVWDIQTGRLLTPGYKAGWVGVSEADCG